MKGRRWGEKKARSAQALAFSEDEKRPDQTDNADQKPKNLDHEARRIKGVRQRKKDKQRP